MHIEFERSGGFAGRRLETIIESSNLQEEQAHRLQFLLAETHFFNLPERLDAPEEAVDRFCYRIFVDDGERRHEIEAGEEALPAELWPLVEWLTEQARRT
jgi:hypothetical protein